MSQPEKKPLPNRVTCTLCGDQFESESIARIIEWDKAHLCPQKAEKESRESTT